SLCAESGVRGGGRGDRWRRYPLPRDRDPVEDRTADEHCVDMTASPSGESDVDSRDELWRRIEHASSWALQGEVTIQTRFGNFLLADSILLLSWSTVYAGSARAGRTAVLIVLSS